MKTCLLLFLALAGVVAGANVVTPVLLPERIAMGNVNVKVVQPIDTADWIWSPDAHPVRLFRCAFTSGVETATVHVSADNRYVLKLDGKRIARGPERGTVLRWTYRTLRLDLAAGDHVLEAVVDRVGDTCPGGAPLAQLQWEKTGGFILKAEGAFDARLTTGTAKWKVRAFDNVAIGNERGGSFGIGGSDIITGCSPWFAAVSDAEMGDPVVVRPRIKDNLYGLCSSGWRLYPTALPPQLDEVKTPGSFRALSTDADPKHVYASKEAATDRLASYAPLLKGEPVTVPAHTTACLLWDLENYYCAYPELETSGGRGARVEFGWSESLKGPKGKKNRGEFVGKSIRCMNDVFLPDGGEDGFTTAWWRAGRWVRLCVKTADEPLVLRRLAIAEVHYPTPYTHRFACSDPTIAPIVALGERTMQMCTHEMSFDCPFYEQQMYPGDTRLQLLTHAVLAADDRLVRRDIELFDFSRREDGRIGFNFPTSGTQDGASYTFMWPMMLEDCMMWRDNAAWLRQRWPGLVHTMEGFRNFENAEGLPVDLPGWNFMDWTDWPAGCPSPGCDPVADGTSAFNAVFYVGMLRSAAAVARALGEDAFVAAWEARAKRTSATIVRVFWDEARGAVAGDRRHGFFCEHNLAMALLYDVLPADKAARCAETLVADKTLVPCTVYFSHYLFEAYAKIGRADLILRRLDLWRGYLAKDLKTIIESPETGDDAKGEARSDCHAWGAHPIYHLHANVLGLKPASPFFGSVRIAPQPGGLAFIRSTTPSPKGDIVCDLAFSDGKVAGTVTLPKGLTGTFVWKGKTVGLNAGANEVAL